MRTIVILALAVSALMVSCQKEAGKGGENNLETLHKTVYANSKKYKDITAGAVSIQYLIALDSVKYASYKDSLLSLYFNAGAYDMSALLANDLIKVHPKDTSVMRMLAVSNEAMGLFDEALKGQRALFEATKKPEHLYQVMTLLYKQEKDKEAREVLEQLKTTPGIKEATTVVNYRQGESQIVPLEAAMYNVAGALDYQEGKRKEALANFKKALEIMPEFYQAQMGVQALSQGQ
ncbi:MAG: hypothetical protein SFW35_05965 [Chitinophagales bacterium]|nr:hypothetical protein [Chitinophagales bacterium]